MFELNGHTALVTGASGGIGAEVAEALHRQGATVVLTGTRQAVLDDVASRLDGRCEVLVANLSDADDVSGLVARAGDATGAPIDILVNNAGITRDNLLMRMKDEDWDAVMNVNLKAAMMLSRSALRGMMKARWGRIIQMSSIVGYTGNPGQANYAAAKAGLTGFTKALAAEVASRGVTANIVAPGFIRTPMTDALSEDQKASLMGGIPAARLGEANEVAAAVAFLASEEAGYLTGATLHINGGMAML
ncbi:3-oxoacyl-[acyl-carrier-protein] reductase [Alphaproteobacteria bacterium LSUCC0684]